MTITDKQITAIGSSLKGQKAIRIAAALSSICPLYEISTPDIFHEFIANLMEECAEFSRFEESLNYSAGRMVEVWPSRFLNVKAAEPFAHNPQKLAEKVYGSRKDIGNVTAADGWLFRGGGPIQLTGRYMYTMFTIFYNKKFNTNISVIDMAGLLRTDIEMGIHSACWFFAIAKKLIQLAISDDFKTVVKRINGSYTNLNKRTIFYERAKKAIV
jgi:putative chitinase